MARLGRSYARSSLRPPVVVSAAVTFRPLKVTLSVQLVGRVKLPQRIVRSSLKPPAVIGAPVTFRPVDTTLAPSSRLARAPRPRDIVPAVVAPTVTFGPVTVKLVRTPRQPSLPHYRLQPPTVVGSPTVFRAISVKLTPSTRLGRGTHSFRTALPPPVVVVTPPLPFPNRVVFTRRGPVRIVESKLRPPTVVSRPVVREQQRIRVTLVPQPRQGRLSHYIVRKPTVVAPGTVGRTPLTLVLATPAAMGLTSATSGSASLTPATAAGLTLNPATAAPSSITPANPRTLTLDPSE